MIPKSRINRMAQTLPDRSTGVPCPRAPAIERLKTRLAPAHRSENTLAGTLRPHRKHALPPSKTHCGALKHSKNENARTMKLNQHRFWLALPRHAPKRLGFLSLTRGGRSIFLAWSSVRLSFAIEAPLTEYLPSRLRHVTLIEPLLPR
jgi:hypothetical protein